MTRARCKGDTTPHLLPAPSDGGGCGGLGAIIVAIVVIVVAVVSQQYYLAEFAVPEGIAYTGAVIEGSTVTLSSAATYSLGDLAIAGAIGGAAGSVAGQFAGNLVGIQDGFSWKGVALGAISGGVSYGLGGVDFTGGAMSNAIVRAAVGNALTQGIAVATGLQGKFSWKGVAAAVGAGVGYGVGQALGADAPLPDGQQGPLRPAAFAQFGQAGQIARASLTSLTGLAAGLSTAVARGGRVNAIQIATDAFGNALGSSWGEQINASVQEGKLAQVNAENQREMNRFASGAATNLANSPGGASQATALAQDEQLGGGALRSRGLAAPGMQAQSDALLYGFGTNNDGLGFKAFGNTGLRYGGVMQTQTPDDTRVVRDFDPENKWDPEAPGPTGDHNEHLVAQLGLLVNPATAGGAVGGGYRPIRPTGAGGPPGYDIRTDMSTDVPGYKQADPGLGLGAPVKPNDGPSWLFSNPGFPLPVRVLGGLLDNLMFKRPSEILGDNLDAAGYRRPVGSAAHHIVPEGDKRANDLRIKLGNLGIDINSADNGVFLPQVPGSSAPGAYHPKLNNPEYHDQLKEDFRNVGSKNDALDVLDRIRGRLLNGTYPGSRPVPTKKP